MRPQGPQKGSRADRVGSGGNKDEKEEADGRNSRRRVFVSSVVEGFEAYRDAARIGIENAGGEAVLVNEQFPSAVDSSRNACLDAIDSCDYFVVVLGGRGGWRTPSGRLVVEEEIEHARRRKIPALVFLEKIARDADADQLARRLSDYIDGMFRVQFTGPKELADEVERALRPLLERSPRATMHSDPIAAHFSPPHQFQDQVSLRFAIAPERAEEVFDPLELASPEFAERLMECAHAKDVRLFGYQFAKSRPELKEDSLIIEQLFGQDWRSGRQGVRLSIAESGIVLIDTNVSGRAERNNSYSMADIMTVPLENIEALLETNFRFVHALYEDKDPFKRHQRFFWNAALSGVGHRTFERNAQQRNSYSMSSSETKEPLLAFSEARLIQRSDIVQSAKEIERAILNWTRRRG